MAFLVAGTQSGCGKTTVTLALMQHQCAAGMSVAPFKAGPDFLDPMWHQAVCKRASYNLDTRMMGGDECRRVFVTQTHDADVAIIEGVMGMFDGAKGVGGEGSSAHLAKALDVPVLLTVNAKGMSGSIVPLIEGFVRRADSMGVHIAGIIANRTGSERHAGLLRDLLAEHDLPPLMGWMQKGAPTLAERHLGLVTPDEIRLPDFSNWFHIEESIFTAKIKRPSCCLDARQGARRVRGKSPRITKRLQAVWTDFRPPAGRAPQARVTQRHKEENETVATSESQSLNGKKVAVARDAAFCFIYPANLDWMKITGAEICYFSPLAGEPVPEQSDSLWLPGGYPELFTEALSTSSSWESLRAFIEMGRPVLAECGGMMILGETLTDCKGSSWAMSAALPCSFEMQGRLESLGYRKESGGTRGHEFHHSRRAGSNGAQPAFDLNRGDQGMRYKNLRASFVHWYFPSQPEVVTGWFT